MSLAGVRPHLRMRRIAAALAAAMALTLVLLAGAASPAAAHATLLRSEPADDAMLAAAPESFRLTFNEPVSALALKLIGPDGAARTLDGLVAKGAELVIAASPGMAEGSHALSWRVVSEDGHPVGGTLVFSIGARSGGEMTSAPPPDRTRQAAVWAARLALYAGLFVGVGGAFAIAWLGGAGGRSVAASAMTAGLAAAALSVGLQGADALEASVAALLEPIIWTIGFATSFGRTALIAAAALALGLVSLRLSGASAKAASALALAGVGLALAASGHASAAAPQWLTRPAVFAHAVGLAFWLGALAPLLFMLADRGSEPASMLRRFSIAAPAAVGAIVLSGIALAFVQLGSVAALWTTAYGAVFLTKLALLFPLFALAALNRWRLTGPAAAGEASADNRLRRSIVVELVLAALILGVVAGWRFTPPPRALAAVAAEPAQVHIHTAKAMADLTLTPGRAGHTSASIVIMTGDFGPLDAKEVTLVFSHAAAGVEPIRRTAKKPGDGTWRVDDLTLPVAGRWTVRLDVLVSDFELVKLDGAVDLRP